jgi:hypothetical protein
MTAQNHKLDFVCPTVGQLREALKDFPPGTLIEFEKISGTIMLSLTPVDRDYGAALLLTAEEY